MTRLDPTDFLKYAAAEGKALLNSAGERLSAAACNHPDAESDIERVQDILEKTANMLAVAAVPFCRDGADLDFYTDGRPVTSRIEIEPGNIIEYRWHPHPQHRINRPHTVIDRIKCANGAIRSVVVSGDGVLDTIDHGHGLHVAEGHQ